MKNRVNLRMGINILVAIICFCMSNEAMAKYYPQFKWKVKKGKMALVLRESKEDKSHIVTDFIFSPDYKASFYFSLKEPQSITPFDLEKKQVSDYIFLVNTNEGEGMVNGKGEAVFPYGKYGEIAPFCLYAKKNDNSFYMEVKKGGKWGILKLKNAGGHWEHRLVTDCEYDRIEQFTQDYWIYTDQWYSPRAVHKEVKNPQIGYKGVYLRFNTNLQKEYLTEADTKVISVYNESNYFKNSLFLCEKGGKARVFSMFMDTYWLKEFFDTESFIDAKTKERRLINYQDGSLRLYALIQDTVPCICGWVDGVMTPLKVGSKPSQYNEHLRYDWSLMNGILSPDVLTNQFNNSRRLEAGKTLRVLLNDSVDYYERGMKYLSWYDNPNMYCSSNDYTKYDVPAEHDGWFTCVKEEDNKPKIGMIAPEADSMLYFDNAQQLLPLCREVPLNGSWYSLQYEGFGLHNTSTGLIIPTVYQEVKPLEGTSCVLVRHIDKWGLVGPSGMLAPAIFNTYEVKDGVIKMIMNRWQAKYGFFNYENPLYPQKVASPYVVTVDLNTLEVKDNFGTLLSYYEKTDILDKINAELVSLAYYLDNDEYHALCLYSYGISLLEKDEQNLEHSIMCMHKAGLLSKDKLYADTEKELVDYWRKKKDAAEQAAREAAAQAAREAAEERARRRQAIIDALNNLSVVLYNTSQQLSAKRSSGKSRTASTSSATSVHGKTRLPQTIGSSSSGAVHTKSNSSAKHNFANIKWLERAYDDYGKMLSKMRYGYITFNAGKAKEYQREMKEIRMQLERDYGVTWLSTTWENWNFVSDPPKK